MWFNVKRCFLVARLRCICCRRCRSGKTLQSDPGEAKEDLTGEKPSENVCILLKASTIVFSSTVFFLYIKIMVCWFWRLNLMPFNRAFCSDGKWSQALAPLPPATLDEPRRDCRELIEAQPKEEAWAGKLCRWLMMCIVVCPQRFEWVLLCCVHVREACRTCFELPNTMTDCSRGCFKKERNFPQKW